MRGLACATVLILTLAGAVSATQPAADWEATVSVDFTDTPVREVLESIARGGRLTLVYDDKFDRDATTTVSLKEHSVRDALRFVTRANRLFFVELEGGSVLVAPDTRQMRQEHMPQGVHTFRLRHADPKGVIALLRSLLQTRNLVLDERLSSVTMSDTTDQIELAAELVRRMDRAADDLPATGAAERDPLWVGSAYSRDLCTLGDPVPTLADPGKTVTLAVQDASAREMYEALGKATGIEFLFDPAIDLERKVSGELSGVSAPEAIELLDKQLGSFAVVWGPRTVFVVPGERFRRDSEEHVAIQFFFLAHADAKSVITALRSTLQVRRIAEIPRLNAVVIRDTATDVAAAQDLVAEMDRPGE